VADESDDFSELFETAAGGGQAALGELLDRNRTRLRRMVRLRMDRRVRGRVDPSDVIQETFVEAARRFSEYAKQPSVPFFVWLRFLAVQRLQMLQRHHLGAQVRDARRDISLSTGEFPEAESEVLAAHLVASLTSPSLAAARAELKVRLLEALDAMQPIDREVLALRHFEQLSNSEAAQVLGVTSSAACNRYMRALERFRLIITASSGNAAELTS